MSELSCFDSSVDCPKCGGHLGVANLLRARLFEEHARIVEGLIHMRAVDGDRQIALRLVREVLSVLREEEER